MEIVETFVSPAVQVALIIGIAEVIKRLGLPSRFIPLIDIALGVISGIFYYWMYMQVDLPNAILLGIAIGLSACGLFSGIKNIVQGAKDGD